MDTLELELFKHRGWVEEHRPQKSRPGLCIQHRAPCSPPGTQLGAILLYSPSRGETETGKGWFRAKSLAAHQGLLRVISRCEGSETGSCSGCLCDRYKGVGWETGLGKDAVGHLLRCAAALLRAGSAGEPCGRACVADPLSETNSWGRDLKHQSRDTRMRGSAGTYSRALF